MSRFLSLIVNGASGESRRIALGLGSAWLQFASSLFISFLRYGLFFAYIPREELGIGILMMTAVTFLSIFDSTLAPGITTEVGRAWKNGIPGEVISSCRHVYRRALPIFMVVSIAVFPAILFFASDFGNHRLLGALWAMFALRAGLGIFGNGKFHILTGTGWYYAGRTGQMAADFSGLAVLYLGLRAGLGLIAIATTGVAEGLVLWLAASWFFKKRIETDPEKRPVDEIVERLQSSSLAMLGNSLSVFLIYHTDNFFLARYVGLGTIADYSIAYKLAFLIPTFCNPFYTVIYPRFVNALKNSNRGELREFFGLVRLNHLLASAMGLGIIVFGRYVIDLWVGPGHYIGIGVIAFMVATFMLDNIHYPHGYTFLSKNRPKILMYAAAGAGLLNLALTAYLAPRFGAIGVAAGTFFAQLACTNVLVPFLSLRELKYGIFEYVYRILLPIASVWSIFAAYWVLRMPK